jgi:hypothetical protein
MRQRRRLFISLADVIHVDLRIEAIRRLLNFSMCGESRLLQIVMVYAPSGVSLVAYLGMLREGRN